MRCHLLRRCLLFATLGLITSIAVAWALTIYCGLRPIDTSSSGVGVAVIGDIMARVVTYRDPGLYTQQWTLIDIAREGPLAIASRQSVDKIRQIGGAAFDARGGPGWWDAPKRIDHLAARAPASALRGIGADHSFIEFTWAGWPFPALKGSVRADFDSASPMPNAPWADRYMLRFTPPFTPGGSEAAYSGTIRLPLEPRPGLLLSTLFYALLWAILLLAPGALRRRIRRARGRCPTCGYSLRGQPSPGCPECGAGRQAPTTALAMA